MDFWYDLADAAPLTEYVGYFSPVAGVDQQIPDDAEAAATRATRRRRTTSRSLGRPSSRPRTLPDTLRATSS